MCAMLCLRCCCNGVRISSTSSITGSRWSIAWSSSSSSPPLKATLNGDYTTSASAALLSRQRQQQPNHQTWQLLLHRRYQHQQQQLPQEVQPSLSASLSSSSSSGISHLSPHSPTDCTHQVPNEISRTLAAALYCPAHKVSTLSIRHQQKRCYCISSISGRLLVPTTTTNRERAVECPAVSTAVFGYDDTYQHQHQQRRHFLHWPVAKKDSLTRLERAAHHLSLHSTSRQASYLSMAEISLQNPPVKAGDTVLEKSNSANLVQLSQIDYKTAIELLNQLQTNAENIAQAIEKERSSNAVRSLDKTRHFLSLMDIAPERLNSLQVVHVAGTKGKGSTCAFVERILRQQGLKTGFYSSPHLVAARERIRLNGEPLSEADFTRAFATVYETLQSRKSPDTSMPAYFLFMTLMAFEVFLREKVDVAILEVGIGGEYDCTNVVPKPVVTGVTSLDLDHTKLLGETIEEIAWQKAGIFKPGVPAYTVAGQAAGAMRVLKERAVEKGCQLQLAPTWEQYPLSKDAAGGGGGFTLGEVQKINASLAVQLAHCWLVNCAGRKKDIESANPPPVLTTIEPSFRQALAATKWLGRCEVIEPPAGSPFPTVTYFLDAAHTPDSMQNCRDWFQLESGRRRAQQTPKSSNLEPYRILIFNCTGERNPRPLLSKLSELPFELALFTTNSLAGDKAASSDVANFTVTSERERQIVTANASAMAEIANKDDDGRPARLKLATVDCISDAIERVQSEAAVQVDRPVHVLITGSVHLVGGFLGLLHPHFTGLADGRSAATTGTTTTRL